jgi:hypothetical protein
MNAQTTAEASAIETLELEPADTARQLPTVQQAGAVAPVSMSQGEAFMLTLLDRGLNFDQIERAMDLKDRMDAKANLQAFNEAFASFKAEAIRIIKNRQVTDGPLRGKSYAELFAVVDAVTPALSKFGLSTWWKRTKDEKDWIEVTCYLKHVSGHFESVSMGGPPDAGGAKNAMQARQSTESYLERYTLKSILGVAEGGEDDDGNGGNDVEPLLDEFRAAAMEGTAKLRARYERNPPPDAFWAQHAKSLKAAAKKADEAAQ